MQIADFKVRLESKVHGSYNSITDVDGLILEAARNVLLMIDPLSTKRVSPITNAIYDSVYSYSVPSDLKGDKIIDIRPQANRLESDIVNQTYQKDFDVFKDSNTFAIEMNSGVKTIKLNKTLIPGIVVEDSISTDEWSTGGNATDLTTDTLNKISGQNSLKFNISAGGTSAYIENSSLTATDLTTIKTDGALFAWVYIPDATIITSINLLFGSSSANYLSKTVTTTQDNTAFVNGWNLLRFDWGGATTTGTPDETAINYIRFTCNYDGTAVNSVRLDSIIARIGEIYDMVYYSKYLFKSESGTWKEEPTEDSDYINLDVEEQNLLLYEACFLVAQEFGGEDSSFDSRYWAEKRNEVWEKYMRTYKSERRKPTVKYYRM
jgi:hypothetical protein